MSDDPDVTADLNRLDAVVHILGIEDSHEEPADCVRALQARIVQLEQALRNARPLVEKWCHYQGATLELLDQYLGPIDEALSGAGEPIDYDAADVSHAVGFRDGCLKCAADMRKRAARLIERTFPLDADAAMDLAIAIRALPLTESKADD